MAVATTTGCAAEGPASDGQRADQVGDQVGDDGAQSASSTGFETALSALTCTQSAPDPYYSDVQIELFLFRESGDFFSAAMLMRGALDGQSYEHLTDGLRSAIYDYSEEGLVADFGDYNLELSGGDAGYSGNVYYTYDGAELVFPVACSDESLTPDGALRAGALMRARQLQEQAETLTGLSLDLVAGSVRCVGSGDERGLAGVCLADWHSAQPCAEGGTCQLRSSVAMSPTGDDGDPWSAHELTTVLLDD
ncbi:MAG: hypothetical protein AAGC55_25160 [Myxococcota bacterium]